MQNFILNTKDGKTFKISEEELKKINNAKGLFTLSCGAIVDIPSAISTIYPESKAQEFDRKEQQIGVLHDGSLVKRHFGRWVVNELVPDDKGNYVPIEIDPRYYPEIAIDKVKTPQEYEEWKKMIVGGNKIAYLPEYSKKELNRYLPSENGMTSVGDII